MELSSAELANFNYKEYIDPDLSIYFNRIPKRYVIPEHFPEAPLFRLNKFETNRLVKVSLIIAKYEKLISINEFIPDTESDELSEFDRYCDTCQENIPWISSRYTNKATDMDMCMECAAATAPPSDWELVTIEDIEAKTREFERVSNFGQFFDWLPIYAGARVLESCGHIMICANPESTLFGRFALATGSERLRDRICICEAGLTIEDLIQEYLELDETTPEYDYDDEEKKYEYFCNLPIKRMMKKRGMKTLCGGLYSINDDATPQSMSPVSDL